MTVTQQTLRTELDQAVIIATAEVGSPSQAAMTLLVHTAATSRDGSRAPQSSRRLSPLPE